MSAAPLLESSLNHLLGQSPGAAELLGRHAGQVVRLDLALGHLDFRIAADGSLSIAETESPDAILRLTPSLVTRLPFFGRDAMRPADYSGDADLLHTLDKVFRDLSWDIETQLAPVLGDIVAHRVTTVGRDALRTLRQAAQSLQTSASEYVVEELELIARKVDVARFNHEIDTLADDVARLEARLARVESNKSLRDVSPLSA